MGNVSCSTSSYLTINQCNNVIGSLDPPPYSSDKPIPSSCGQDINDIAVTCCEHKLLYSHSIDQLYNFMTVFHRISTYLD